MLSIAKMRTKLLFGNWKMNSLKAECSAFLAESKNLLALSNSKHVEIGLAPSYLYLDQAIAEGNGITVYAQDVSDEEKGAYTGQVSVSMLLDHSVCGSLVGHSERRAYCNETDLKCNLKIKKLLKAGLGCIYCVGETLAEYDKGLAKDVIKAQIEVGLMNLKGLDLSKLVIAYEPVWSIGTGKNASEEIAQDICSYIRSLIKDMYGEEVASSMRILYGGSVKPENIHSYLKQDDVDGALVGGASLKADSFAKLIENCQLLKIAKIFSLKNTQILGTRNGYFSYGC